MQIAILAAAIIVLLLTLTVLTATGIMAIAISGAAWETRWNDNDDRRGKKHEEF